MQCASVASTPTLAIYGEGVQRILFIRRIESLLNTRMIYEGDKEDLSLNHCGIVEDCRVGFTRRGQKRADVRVPTSQADAAESIS
jgi:hypothetical protein